MAATQPVAAPLPVLGAFLKAAPLTPGPISEGIEGMKLVRRLPPSRSWTSSEIGLSGFRPPDEGVWKGKGFPCSHQKLSWLPLTGSPHAFRQQLFENIYWNAGCWNPMDVVSLKRVPPANPRKLEKAALRQELLDKVAPMLGLMPFLHLRFDCFVLTFLGSI